MMGKTIPVDQLPREAERLLCAAWEEHESVVLERNGEPVAAVVPMDEYRRLRPAWAESGPLVEELPAGLVERYQGLVSKRFAHGLTSEEEAELERLGAELDAADAATPLEREADARARREHDRRISILIEILGRLRSPQGPL
jgi:prevent-host-death family protein